VATSRRPPLRLYLVELQSGSGLSGLPVFARLPAARGAGASPVSLLGTLVGQWDDDDANRTGLAKVLPAQLLRDLLFQEDEVERRREAEQRDDGWLADA
jgi:hypothetical protein